MRRLSLLLTSLGVSSEMVAITGMILGILAGFSFMGTREPINPELFWAVGMICCVLRISCLRIDSFLQNPHSRPSFEDIFFSELPERVSDAVTLIGFGFAADSSPWLGLAAALAAIFSAYVRSVGVQRGARKHATSGPMTRIHRLALISATSVLMIIQFPHDRLDTSVPRIALWVIFLGCLATIGIRWLNIQEYDET